MKQPKGVFVSEQEVKNLQGLRIQSEALMKRCYALEASSGKYYVKANVEADEMKKAFYKVVSETMTLKADNVRIENGLRREHEEARSIVSEKVRNYDFPRLERFKRYRLGET